MTKNHSISVEKYFSLRGLTLPCWDINFASWPFLPSSFSLSYFWNSSLLPLFPRIRSSSSDDDLTISFIGFVFVLLICSDMTSSSRTSKSNFLSSWSKNSSLEVLGFDNVSLLSRADRVSLRVMVFLGVGKSPWKRSESRHYTNCLAKSG